MSWEINLEKIKITGAIPEIDLGGTTPGLTLTTSAGPISTLNNSKGLDMVGGDLSVSITTSAGQVITVDKNGISLTGAIAPKIQMTQSGGPTITLNNTVAGVFTCASGYAVSTISNVTVNSTTVIIFSPTNSAAALAVSGAPSPFISALHPGSGFAFSTMNGSHFVGTEAYNYFVWK